MSIRDAHARDWSAIWRFLGDVIAAGESFGYDLDMSERDARAIWFDGMRSRASVAISGSGSIFGSASMRPNRAGPGGHVASATFVVDPAHHGEGVGRALLEDALAWARGAGYRAMQFNAVVETNRPAIALYESVGFTVVGTVPEAFEHPTHGYVALHIMYLRLRSRVAPTQN